jgi:hypothetical protein
MSRLDQFTGKRNTIGVLEQLAEIKGKEGVRKVDLRPVFSSRPVQTPVAGLIVPNRD